MINDITKMKLSTIFMYCFSFTNAYVRTYESSRKIEFLVTEIKIKDIHVRSLSDTNVFATAG